MAKMKRKNPFAKGPTLKKGDIPKGLKSGQVFKRGGKTYMVISYKHPVTNKVVRYARPYKGYKTGKSRTAAQKKQRSLTDWALRNKRSVQRKRKNPRRRR